MAGVKLTGKKKLLYDLNQSEVFVKRAQDELNRTVNGQPLKPGSAEYIAADKKFKDAIAARDAAQAALDNYKEPEKPASAKSAKQIEAERQQALLDASKNKANGTGSADGVVEPDLIKQTNAALADKAKQENATQYIANKLDNTGRKLLADQLIAAGYKAPSTGKYNSALVDAYISALGDAQTENSFNKSVQGYIPNTLESYLTYKAGLTSGTGQSGIAAYIADDTQAAALVKEAFKTNLGREATADEIAKYSKLLISAQKKSPYKTTNGVRTGGINEGEFLAQQIEKLPEYATKKTDKVEAGLQALKATAAANGLDLEENFASQLPEWKAALQQGRAVSDFQSLIRNAARVHLPESVKSNIDPDLDLNSYYSPYINSYAKTFGIPSSAVKIADVEKLALTDKGLKPIYEFDKAKRALPDWQYTQDAQQQVGEVVDKVLTDFGFKR